MFVKADLGSFCFFPLLCSLQVSFTPKARAELSQEQGSLRENTKLVLIRPTDVHHLWKLRGSWRLGHPRFQTSLVTSFAY